MKNRTHKSPFVWFALVLALVVGFAFWPMGDEQVPSEQLSRTAFDEVLATGSVESIEMVEGPYVIRAVRDDGTTFETSYLAGEGDELIAQIRSVDPDVEIEVSREGGGSFWMSLLFSVLPILLLVALFVVVIKMTGLGRGSGQFGKTNARKLAKDMPTVTFADVAGADEAVEELREIKEFLSDPARFYAMGAKIPKGVLLYGPPGTGKTLLARAVAGEAGVPFFSISGSDFVEMFVGVGASRVRDLFAQAKEEAPAIIFVDEIDAVGRHRGAGMGGGHDEREQTLNQMLVEMDGFDPTSGVIMIAATNRPDILDPALLRPGRFDRQITVDRPDYEGRVSILGVHLAAKPTDESVEVETIARRTPGFTGADLANLANEAALLAARHRRPAITMDLIDEADDRVMAGPQRKTRVLGDAERRVIAYHEAGHALVGHVLAHTDPIHKVSIIARGRALGWTLALPENDRYLRTRSQLEDDLAMLLGGRVAEEMIFGDPTTGAADDISRVTDLAQAMVAEYGMSRTLGPRRFGKESGEPFLGKDFSSESATSAGQVASVDSEVDRLVREAYDEARAILIAHWETLDALAEALLEHETLGRDELAVIFADVEPWQREIRLPGTGLGVLPTAAPTPVASAAGDARATDSASTSPVIGSTGRTPRALPEEYRRNLHR
jgi:cell division protease FtsH